MLVKRLFFSPKGLLRLEKERQDKPVRKADRTGARGEKRPDRQLFRTAKAEVEGRRGSEEKGEREGQD